MMSIIALSNVYQISTESKPLSRKGIQSIDIQYGSTNYININFTNIWKCMLGSERENKIRRKNPKKKRRLSTQDG